MRSSNTTKESDHKEHIDDTAKGSDWDGKTMANGEHAKDHDGMKFTLCVAYKPIRPVFQKSISPKTLVANVMSIKEWEIMEEADWNPFSISGEYLGFFEPQNLSPMKKQDAIGNHGNVVEVRVAQIYRQKAL